MNKLTAAILTTLFCATLHNSSNVAQAASPHPSPGSGSSVSSSAPTLGNFNTLCFSGTGSATAESRNISVGSHNQQVAHLSAQNLSQSIAGINNLNGTTIKQGIYFTLASGTGDYLIVAVDYYIHNSTDHQTIRFITPNSKVFGAPSFQRLFSNGNGNFLIPVDNHGVGQGVPLNAHLTSVFFGQIGAEHTCAVETSDINNVIVNSRAVPIDHSSPSSSCVQSCTPN